MNPFKKSVQERIGWHRLPKAERAARIEKLAQARRR